MDLINLVSRILRNDGLSNENPQLVGAMEAVAKDDGPDARRRLYIAMLDATLLVPTPELPSQWRAPGHYLADGKTEFKIVAVDKPDGTPVTPAFSDEAALRNWDPNMPWITLRARDYFPLVLESPVQEVVINPFDPIRKMIRPGGTVKRWEIESLAKGKLPDSRNAK